MGVLRLLAGLLLLAPLAAAQNTWTGGAVGDWHDGLNWSAGVPGPADDVLIDADSLVIAYATNPAVSLNSLTLGDGAGTFAPVLRLRRGAQLGAAQLHPRAALQLDTTDLMLAAGVFLAQGSSVTAWTVPSALGGGAARFSVTGTFDVGAGATVTVAGRGYAPEGGPGAGAAGSAASGGGGGGHAGAGGNAGGGAAGGAAYGFVSSATLPGSGGGNTPSASGGAGGGVIEVTASTLNVSGLLDADGQAGESVGFEGGGGGAGGSIRLSAAVLSGGGVLSARGANGGTGANFGGGGGAGGRIEARVASSGDLVVSSATHRVSFGTGGGGGTLGAAGGAGSDFMTPRHWTRGGANANASTPANWSGGFAPVSGERVVWGASETARNAIWDLGVAVGSVTVLNSFSSSVVLNSSLTVTGLFEMAGGTLTGAANRSLELRGPLSQTGGLVNLLGSTLTLRGGGYAFFDARATVLSVGGLGAATATVSGLLDARTPVELAAGAHLSLSSGTLKLAAQTGPFAGAGTVSGSSAHVTQAEAALAQVWTTVPGALGGLRVSNLAAGGLRLSTQSTTLWQLEGGVLVDTGAVLTATGAYLTVGGDWASYGAALLSLSTVSFDAASGTQTVVHGASFPELRVDAAAGAVTRFSTQVVVASTLTVASGTLDLNTSTVVVKGGWLELPGASVRGANSVAVFDGDGPIVVHSLGGNSFGAFFSSAATSLHVSSQVTALSHFQWHRGALDIAGRDVFVGGDLLNQGFGTLSSFLSTVTLNGSAFQVTNFTQFHGLVIDNRSPAGARIGLNLAVSSFTIRPGASFDGFNRVLVLNGHWWDTALSTYNSIAQIHQVQWNPQGSTLQVGAGSIVNAKVFIANNRAVQLLGDLTIQGAGNSFDPRSGAALLNAPGGSTITFQGSSDLAPTNGANWTYGGDVADSWLVFEGTGLARGLSMSTNTLGSVRLAMDTATDSYRAPDMTLLRHLVVEGGSFKPNGAKTITLGGDLIQTASGVVSFASTGTLRMIGPSTQTLRLVSSSHTLLHAVFENPAGVTLQSDLTVKGDFVVAAGTFSAGSGTLSLQGTRVVVATAAWFDGGSSTVTFGGAFNGKTWTGVSFHGGGAFAHGTVVVSSVAFLTNTTFTALTHTLAASTMAVAPGMRLKTGSLSVDPAGGPRIRLRSTSDGLPWYLELVSVSSVTGCIVSDSDASPGLTVRADDGRCSDQGGNANWDFDPQLVTVFPGEALTPGVAPGKSGAPLQLTAGATSAVTVQALSSRFDPIFISSPVAVVSDDPWAEFPASLTLVGGATGFAYSPRTAEPAPRASVVSAVASFGSGGSSVTVVPDALERLQLVMPGETVEPGRPGGKTGTPFARVRDVPFTLTVRAVDRYANLIATVTHAVSLNVSASSSTLPAAAPLVAGTRVFTGLAVHVTGFFTLSGTDLTDAAVLPGTSAVFGVSPPSISSPTAAFHVPPGARVATLGGAVSGTASDSSSVERVTLSLFDATAGLHYDWASRTFSSVAPQFATATLAVPLAPDTTWHITAPDVAFVTGRRYVFSATVDDPTGFTGAASSTFTFDAAMLDFGLKDGQGSASALPVSTAGCTVITSSIPFTVGAAGIAPGGAVALRAPEGWTVAAGTTTTYPPPLGYWHATSTSLAFPTARLSVSSTTPGPGWLLLEASTASAQSFLPGQLITFTYTGLPPLSAAGRGAQAFPLLTRGESGGSLLAISSFPVVTLTAGAAPVVAFADPSPLSLTPLQLSPTMQLTVEDRCGNSLAGLSSGTVNLSVLVPSPSGTQADLTAELRDGAGTPITSVFLSTGFALSPSFTLRSSTIGPSELLIRGVGSFGNNPAVPVEAVRLVRLTTAPLAFTAVAASTAPLPAGSTSAALSAADPQGVPGRIAFRLDAPAAEWELVLSTDPGRFEPAVLRATGRGEAGKTFVVAWDGVDRVSDPPRYAAPGRYRARLKAGVTAVDTSVEMVVPQGAAFSGQLGARGAGAWVRAYGPGAADGAFAVASSTGWFLLRGVRPGQAYRVTASTVSSAGGRLVSLSTTVLTGAAAAPWLDLGSLSLPATGQLRVAVASPVPAPRELVGAWSVRAPDGRVLASAPLRFSSASASSDDAGPLFGRPASTWSAAAVPAGDWTLEVELPELRLSTSVLVSVPAGGGADARLVPPKRGAVLGYAVLPSTSALGARVAVDARLPGEPEPAAGAVVFVSSVPPAVGLSSGAFGLFGLEAGTYTVTASADGFAAASSTVYVSTGADVPLVLALGTGSSVTGALRVLGDSTGLGPVFDAVVEARAEGRLETSRTRVRLGASATLSSGAYALGGLSTGTWTVTATLPGFALSPSTGVRVAAPGAAALDLAPAVGRLRVTVTVPPPAGGGCRAPAAYAGVGLVLDDAAGGRRFIPEITSPGGGGAFTLTHCTSATVLTPALAPGRATAWAGFLENGARAFGGATLAAGATSALALDLSLATTSVSGRVAVLGEFTLSSRTAAGVPFTVSLASAAGLNAWAPGPGPVLIGSAAPTPVGAFRAELRPVDPEGRVSTQAALASAIGTDGSYHFAGVSAGRWSLRVPGELDGDPANGEEAAAAESAFAVGATPVTVNLSFGRGATLSGRVSAPGGTRLTRVLRVLLAGEDGGAPRRVDVAFSDSDSAPFAFPGLAPGRWRLSVEDPGRPAAWTAAPRLLELGAAGLSGVDLRLESAGSILGRLALARERPDGTQERVLVTGESAELLPPGLSIVARALPPAWGSWSADAGLDADGRFLVAGLPAGSYELSVTAPAGLAPAVVGGIAVAAGRAADPGTVVLRRAAALTGLVRDSSTGLPVAGVAVTARPSSRASAAVRALTDAAGLYRLDALDPEEGFYDLTAAPRGAESAADSPPPYAARRLLGVDLSTGGVADFALSPAAALLRGRVTTPDGRPLAAGALVTLQAAGLPPDEDPLADLLFRTGADGRFAIPSLSTGAYRLGVSAEGYGSLARAVSIAGASTDLGDLLLPGGAVLQGALRRHDGAPPSEAEVRAVAAATPDLNEFVWGTVSREAGGGAVSYRVGGLRTGRTYRLLLITGEDEPVVPPGGSSFVFASSAEVRGFDAVARPPAPSVSASARRAGSRVSVSFAFSRALRSRTPADADPSQAVTRTSGAGLLSGARLSADRRSLSVDYDPAAGESAFALRARAAVAEEDPDAADAAFPELMADATAFLRADVDAQLRAVVPNALGGTLSVGEDGGRVVLPRGAFSVDAASTVALTFTRSTFNVTGAAPPGGLSAASPFFDVAVPAGVGATLSRPARLVLPYSAGVDPGTLALYWYNPGNGSYVLTPDALGQAPEVDAAARTYAVNVGHFSTYVLLPAGAAVIGGAAHSGSLEAYAFPNPFDLRPKTVTTIHGGGTPVIRGTMLRVAVPASGGGAGKVRVFDAAGRLVRELALGDLAPGTNYYVDWDGRNSAGADVASGLYLAVVSVGGKSKTVKLAVLK